MDSIGDMLTSRVVVFVLTDRTIEIRLDVMISSEMGLFELLFLRHISSWIRPETASEHPFQLQKLGQFYEPDLTSLYNI